jgi:hypothetical protein
MSGLEDVDPERRALFGFSYAMSEYRGWFDFLFQDYTLYPYLNIERNETKQLLYKKNLLLKLVPIFAKQLRVTSIVNKIIGMELLSKGQGPGLIEELATVLTDEAESRRTIEKRLLDVEGRLNKEHKYFCGMSHAIYGRPARAVLRDRNAAVEGSLIAIEGIMNHVDAIGTVNPATARTFEGTGIKWVLADFPYFELVSKNENYDGNHVGLRMDESIAAVLKSFPFDDRIGWYPYVTVFGVFHNSLSPKHAQIKAIDWCWMKLRLPKSYEELPALLKDVLSQPHDDVDYHPWLDLTRERDIPMFLSAIQIANLASNLDYALVRDDTKALAKQALGSSAPSVPEKIKAYFQ